MPRLLRRLAQFLEAESAGKIRYRQRRPKSRDQQEKVVQPPDKRPPIVYKRDLGRSFLLDINPITEKGLYHVPKEPPPSLPSQQRVLGRSNGRRGMNELELDATASPYGKFLYFLCPYTHVFLVRMLSSPLRTCLFTRAVLPKGQHHLHLTSHHNSNVPYRHDDSLRWSPASYHQDSPPSPK
jgi:hypothetical protein